MIGYKYLLERRLEPGAEVAQCPNEAVPKAGSAVLSPLPEDWKPDFFKKPFHDRVSFTNF